MRTEKYEVKLEGGITLKINTNDYVKCAISVAVPCDNKEDGYKEADEFIEKHLEEFVNQAKDLANK